MAKSVKLNIAHRLASNQSDVVVSKGMDTRSDEALVIVDLGGMELEKHKGAKVTERQNTAFEEFDDIMLSQLKNTTWGVVSE